MKMYGNLSIRAGKKALEIIRDEGFEPSRVKVVAGASGAAKFLVLTGIDRAFLAMVKDRKQPLYLIGTSIGAFRMAAYCQKDPIRAIDTLERDYIAQHYGAKATREDVSLQSRRILDSFIADEDVDDILSHPFMRLSFLANKCKGPLRSDNKLLQAGGLILASGANRIHRRMLGLFFKRALFHENRERPPFAEMNDFPLDVYSLAKSNFKNALMASASIPYVMRGIDDIQGIPGMFRDGGILDYHLDLPFLPKGDDGIVFYPHFYPYITPGWFDKNLGRKPHPENMENVVLVSPSEKFVKDLPFGKIPDRMDFGTFAGDSKGRMAYWRESADLNVALGEEFYEAVQSNRIKEMVTLLD
jgi:hypothetical protein